MMSNRQASRTTDGPDTARLAGVHIEAKGLAGRQVLSPPMPWICGSKSVDMGPARISGGLLLPSDSADFLPSGSVRRKANRG